MANIAAEREIASPPVRCWRCDKLLANSARQYNITCPRCHATNQG